MLKFLLFNVTEKFICKRAEVKKENAAFFVPQPYWTKFKYIWL